MEELVGRGALWRRSAAEELNGGDPRQRNSVEEIRDVGARWRRSSMLRLEREGGKARGR
jgi:hypothetical protein